MIHIENDGPEIVRTIDFESEYAVHGFAMLSSQAGCLRLLVPEKIAHFLPDMTTNVTCVEVSVTDPATWQPRTVVGRVMFDDRTDTPFALDVSAAQMVMAPQPGPWKFAIWGSGPKCLFTCDASVKRVEKLVR